MTFSYSIGTPAQDRRDMHSRQLALIFSFITTSYLDC